MSSKKVSVIIPAFNAANTIRESIKAVLAQSFTGQIELIVINDGSQDATSNIVSEFNGVRCFYQDNQGPAAARNRGAAEAEGDVLLFTDADCCPDPGWVQGAVDALQDVSVGVVAGSYGIANPDDVLARIIHGEIRFRHLKLMPDYPNVFGSYNFAIRPALFSQCGGFNAAYRRASGEDNDLSYRVVRSGARIRFLPDLCVKHYHQNKLKKYLYEQYRHGFWRARLYFDHSHMLAGDGYTFWKDSAEVVWVLAHVVAVVCPLVFIILAASFLFFEILFGVIMLGSLLDGVLAGVVMWLRSFARVAGLLSGGVFLMCNQSPAGKKS